MNDTQNPGVSPAELLDLRLQDLTQLHSRYVNQLKSLDAQRENVVASIFKLEGAIEALADYKSTTFGEVSQEDAASNEEGEEAVDATYTESVN
jgi:hypothetical protein